MKEIEELQDQVKDPKVVIQIIKEAGINPRILELINEEAICETFHKLPGEVREMDCYDFDTYSAILQGRQEAQKSKS